MPERRQPTKEDMAEMERAQREFHEAVSAAQQRLAAVAERTGLTAYARFTNPDGSEVYASGVHYQPKSNGWDDSWDGRWMSSSEQC